MNARSWAPSDDLSSTIVAIVVALALVSLLLLFFELRRRQKSSGLIFSSGMLASVLLAAAVLRPVRVLERGSLVGPKLVVLFDESRRLLLPAPGGATRRARAKDAMTAIRKHFSESRITAFGFGDGALEPLPDDPAKAHFSSGSDLSNAVSALAQTPGERPKAVIVVSDGRLSRPGAVSDDEALTQSVGALGVPIHTVRLAETGPRDASIRSVRAAGAAVAHQPLSLTIEIGCSSGLDCGSVPVAVRELRQGVEPAVLASGTAKVEDGSGTVELRITLDRAGERVVEVSIDAPDGDQVPENDRRYLTFNVTRERVRILHLAGRPTYDVRALRMWLKADESVDLVSFFILRTGSDDTMADDSDLALIEFPVNELFTEHLPSFDAVILQDIDAKEYKLDVHFPALARYVESGGGLVMVGGPTAFIGGNYADTAIGRVLPVELPKDVPPDDAAEFSPRYTDAGRVAPVLRGLRELLGEELPTMVGSNTLGEARPNAITLLEHPNRKAGDGPMPILALGEAGDGRTIALGIDGSYRLKWSELAASVAGRAFGALWDGLLGWLMRDPRYEAARAELEGECIAGEPVTLRLTRLPGNGGDVQVHVEPLGKAAGKSSDKTVTNPPPGPVEIPLGPLEPGGYVARMTVGRAPATRLDFACEKGGEAWADSRPDPDRLERISRVTGGKSVEPDGIGDLPLPPSTRISAERHVTPVIPPWAWTALAAVALGAHWLARRRVGLT